MEWTLLKEEKELDHIKAISSSQPVIIFKHSTRCSISSTALNRLERSWKEEEMKNVKPYFLDLIAYRSISDQIENIFQVAHESPQLLIIKNGTCIYHTSHLSISYPDLLQEITK